MSRMAAQLGSFSLISRWHQAAASTDRLAVRRLGGAEIRQARASDWELLRELRLRALADAPDASLSSTLDKEARHPQEVWRRWADDVTGQEIPCGHFLPEEAPDAVLTALLSFLDQKAVV